MICKKCSNQLSDNATVCSRCGKKVKKSAPLNKGLLIAVIVLAVALIGTATAFTLYYLNNDGGSAPANVVDNSEDKNTDENIEKEIIAEPEEKEPLTIATESGFRPFVYFEGEELVGADIEIIQEISERMGRKIELSDISFDTIVPSVAAGKYDAAITGIAITEDRKEHVAFSDAYYEPYQIVLVGEDSDITSIIELEGKTISCQQGTTGEYVLAGAGYDPLIFEYATEAYDAVVTGQADAVVIDSAIADKINDENGEALRALSEPLYAEEYAIVVNKEDKELLKEINKHLRDMKKDGTLEEILEKYEL